MNSKNKMINNNDSFIENFSIFRILIWIVLLFFDCVHLDSVSCLQIAHLVGNATLFPKFLPCREINQRPVSGQHADEVAGLPFRQPLRNFYFFAVQYLKLFIGSRRQPPAGVAGHESDRFFEMTRYVIF